MFNILKKSCPTICFQYQYSNMKVKKNPTVNIEIFYYMSIYNDFKNEEKKLVSTYLQSMTSILN